LRRPVGAAHAVMIALIVGAVGLLVVALAPGPAPEGDGALRPPPRPTPVPPALRPPPTALQSVSPPVIGARVACAPTGCTVSWETAAPPVRILTGPTADRIDRTAPVAEVGTGSEVTVPGTGAGDRRYFEVVAAGEDRGPVVGDRYLGLEGAPGTRDLGGYSTVDGRRIRWGTLFRTGGLTAVTAADRRRLASLGLPDDCPAPGRTDRAAPRAPGAVTTRAARTRDARWLRRLARGSGPEWVHCDAAGDRRGWPTTLLLATVGVARETVVADHLLTNRPPPGGAAPARPVTRAPVDTAFEAIIGRYGTVARYLDRGLGLDAETVTALRDRFLAPR